MKKFLIIMGGLLGIILCLAFLAPMVLDAEQFRPLVQKKLEQSLHKNVSFDRMQLSVLPAPTLKMENFRLKDQSLPASKDLMSSPAVSISVDPLSYLKGKPEIRSIEITSPVINLSSGMLQKMNKTSTEKILAKTGVTSDMTMKQVDLQLEKMTIQYWNEPTDITPMVTMRNVRARFWDPDPPEGNPFEKIHTEVDIAGSQIESQFLSIPVHVDSGVVQVLQNKLTIENLALKMEDSLIKGKVQVDSMAEPVVRFEMNCPEMKLENLERWRGKVPSQLLTEAAALTAGSSTLGAKPDIRGTLGIERFFIGPGLAEKVVMQLHWEDGKILVQQLQGKMYEGQLTSSGQIMLQSAIPTYQMKAELKQAQLERMQTPTAGKKSAMEGLLDLTAQFSGAGLNFHQEKCLQQLRAEGNFVIQKGKINSFELSEKLKFLNALAKAASGDPGLSSDLNVQSDFQFDGQRVNNRAMEAHVGLLTLFMKGSFTPKGYLDYEIQPKLQQPAKGRDGLFGAIMNVVAGAVQSGAPFKVRGTMDNLEVIL